MTLSIGSVAPDFEATTTAGPIRFHDWIGDSWAVLFSHPKDFTPVCTTELGYMAKLKPEFDKRNTKVIGLSVDTVDRHAGWAADIEATQGHAPNFPMIGDPELKMSKLYGMLPADAGESCDGRTPADNQTVRNVFVIGPDKKVKLIIAYPMTTGRNFDEVLRVIDSLAAHGEAQGGDAGELAAGTGRDHRRLGVGRRREEDLSQRLEGAAAVPADRPAAAVDGAGGVIDAASAAVAARRSRRGLLHDDRFAGQARGVRGAAARLGGLLERIAEAENLRLAEGAAEE